MIFAALWLSALPGTAAAQAIDTNRPGFSYTPGVVAPGEWQLETGYSYTRYDGSNSESSLPLAEIRTGVGDRVEMFLASVTWSNSDTASGLLDMQLGTKISISEANAKTRMAILFEVSVPVGDDEYTSDSWDPAAAFIWTHDGKIALAGTAKATWFDSNFLFSNSLKLPFTISDDQSAFVEWEANLPEGGDSTHWLNGAYQRLLSDRMQLDFSVGLGLTSDTGDWRAGVGFSMKL